MRLTTVGDKIRVYYKGEEFTFEKTIKNFKLSNIIKEVKIWTSSK
jgi:hypothetical protein